MGAGSELPPNSSDVSPRAHHFGWGPMGETAGADAPPFLRPAALPVPYLAQSAAQAKGRFWKKFLPPLWLSAPSCRVPLAPLVTPPPRPTAPLSERQRLRDWH